MKTHNITIIQRHIDTHSLRTSQTRVTRHKIASTGTNLLPGAAVAHLRRALGEHLRLLLRRDIADAGRGGKCIIK